MTTTYFYKSPQQQHSNVSGGYGAQGGYNQQQQGYGGYNQQQGYNAYQQQGQYVAQQQGYGGYGWLVFN